MDAIPTSNSTNSSDLNSGSAVRELFRTICAEWRHAFELTVEAYSHGIPPPF